MKLQSIAKETAACHADGLREAADAALTEFVDEHGSDFDAQYWPGMAAIRAALQSSLLWLRRGRELSEPRPDAVPALDGETEDCPTCMRPMLVPQRGDHDYGLRLAAPLDGLREALRTIREICKPMSMTMTGPKWFEGGTPAGGGSRERIWRICDAALRDEGETT